MGNKKDFFILNENGQSTVEYILLMVVVVAMISTVFNSSYFKQFFGSNSAFFTTLGAAIERNYRYASKINAESTIGEDPEQNHPSFINTETSSSRFFITKDPYPR